MDATTQIQQFRTSQVARCIDTSEIAHAPGAPCPGSPTNLFVGVVSLGDMGPAFVFPSTRINLVPYQR